MMKGLRWRDIEWWFINRADRKDRLDHIRAELGKAGITAQRFNAYTFVDYKGPKELIANMMHTPGTIGNYMSHMEVVSKAVGGKVIGVLEDDALLCDDFWQRLQYIQQRFDREWDVFYLGATYHVNPPVWHKDDLGKDFELTGIKYIHRVYGAFSNQGYLVNSDSAPKIVNILRDHMAEARGSDHIMIQYQPSLQCFSFTPGMVFQIDGPSDIAVGEHGKRQITVFSHFLKSLGPYVWCRRLEDFDYDKYNWAEGRL
jgi:GR25 family glycosyltransferase involved in LPS biosynthesis